MCNLEHKHCTNIWSCQTELTWSKAACSYAQTLANKIKQNSFSCLANRNSPNKFTGNWTKCISSTSMALHSHVQEPDFLFNQHISTVFILKLFSVRNYKNLQPETTSWNDSSENKSIWAYSTSENTPVNVIRCFIWGTSAHYTKTGQVIIYNILITCYWQQL